MFSFSSIVYSFLWHILSKNRILFAAHIFFAFIIGIFQPLRAYLLKKIIDGATVAIASDSFGQLHSAVITTLAVIFFVIIAFRVYDYAIPLLFARIRKKSAQLLADRMLHHAITFYQEHTPGTIANKINGVVRALPTIEQKTIDGLFVYTLEIGCSLYMAINVGYQFGIALFTWIIACLCISIIAFSYGQGHASHAAHTQSLVAGKLVETGSTIFNIHMFNGYATERQELDKVLHDTFRAENNRDWFLLKINAALSCSFIVILAIMLYLLVKGMYIKTVTAGDFGLITMLAGNLMKLLWMLADDARRFIEEYSIANQGLTLLLQPYALVDVPHAKSLHVTDGIITFDNVTFNYAHMPPIFQKKSITIKKHQKIGLVGPSGSGKSTFVKLIARILDIQHGTITIDHQNIANVTQASLREAISIIPQEPILFSRSIRENIAYAKPNATTEQVIAAAQKAHAHDFIMQLPYGYQTRLEEGIALSGGQKQRIAIARAFLKNTPLLILDEATSSLDAISQEYIQQSLTELMHNKTTLVIAHRLPTVLHMDRILVFDQGCIIADGTHQELLHSCSLYKTLWETQTSGFLNNIPHSDL